MAENLKQIDYSGDANKVSAVRDGIIIRKILADIEGGRALDTTGYTLDIVHCGTPIIANGKQYKAFLPEAGSSSYAFGTLPEGFSYVGLCAATTPANRPVPIIISGVVNEEAMKNEMYSAVARKSETHVLDTSVVKNALKGINFIHDEVYSAE